MWRACWGLSNNQWCGKPVEQRKHDYLTRTATNSACPPPPTHTVLHSSAPLPSPTSVPASLPCRSPTAHHPYMHTHTHHTHTHTQPPISDTHPRPSPPASPAAARAMTPPEPPRLPPCPASPRAAWPSTRARGWCWEPSTCPGRARCGRARSRCAVGSGRVRSAATARPLRPVGLQPPHTQSSRSSPRSRPRSAALLHPKIDRSPPARSG